jgi:hypothetical protein
LHFNLHGLPAGQDRWGVPICPGAATAEFKSSMSFLQFDLPVEWVIPKKCDCRVYEVLQTLVARPVHREIA